MTDENDATRVRGKAVRVEVRTGRALTAPQTTALRTPPFGRPRRPSAGACPVEPAPKPRPPVPALALVDD